MKNIFFITLLLLLSAPHSHADVILMVHGYLGNAASWEHSQVSQNLDSRYYMHGGRFVAGRTGPELLVPKHRDTSKARDIVYLAELPSLAPATLQSDLLQNMLDQLRTKHEDEPITIVGHSAGGLIARLTLVRYGASSVTRLVTIASPHLGTSRAVDALRLTNNHGPFNMVKGFFGGSTYDALKQSRGLLRELATNQPGSMLHWLNSREHPDIEYISVIRMRPNGTAGDHIVPGFSQDMNNVMALQGKSQLWLTPAAHSLNPADAELIISVMQSSQANNG